MKRHMIRTFIVLWGGLLFGAGGIMACGGSSSSDDDKETNTDSEEEPHNGDSNVDTEEDTDSPSSNTDSVNITGDYPAMGDGEVYANMLRMLDSLSKMPDYQFQLPVSLRSSRDIGTEDDNGRLRITFDPDSVEDVQSTHYDAFRDSAVTPSEVSIIKGIVTFLRDHMSQTAVPPGTVEVLGQRDISYIWYSAYHQEEMTISMEMGRMIWFRDETTKAFTIHQSFSGMPDMADRHTTIIGTPISNDHSDITMYEFQVYQVTPTRKTDYNGKAQDRYMNFISYSEASQELLHYQRTLDLPFTIGREDDIYRVGYLYRRYLPNETSDRNEIVFYEERTKYDIVAEIDPLTGQILRWLDDDEETELTVLPADRLSRFAAAGDDDGAILLNTYSGNVVDYFDENANVICRKTPTGDDNGDTSISWFDDDLWLNASWPLKYVRSTDPLLPIEITDTGYYMVGDDVLPVTIHTMGMYDADGHWNSDVPVPFLDAVTLPDIVELLPEKQVAVDQLNVHLEKLTTHMHLPLFAHPYYKFPQDVFTPLLMHGIDGVWLPDDLANHTNEDMIDVLLIDVKPDMPRFEYRRYRASETDVMVLSEVASGIVEPTSVNLVKDNDNRLYGGSLRFVLTTMLSPQLDDWSTPDDYDAASVLTLPAFLYPGQADALFTQDGLALTFEHGRLSDTDRPTHSFLSVPHDPVVAAQVAEQASNDDAHGNDEDDPGTSTIALAPIVWTAVTNDGHFVETTFGDTTWQEVHFLVNDNRDVSVLRAFRGVHTLDAETISGTITVRELYDTALREWVHRSEAPDIFDTMADECPYLSGLTSWDVVMDTQYDTMILTMNDPAPATMYEYRRQTNGVDLSACLLGACAPVAASHCEAAVAGPLAGRGMKEPMEQWNDSSVVSVCTSNCWNHSMCYRAQRLAHFIDCTNQVMLCSDDWQPIDVNSCDRLDSFPSMNQAYQECLQQCQMELEVPFPDPAGMLSTVQQCVSKYGAYPMD